MKMEFSDDEDFVLSQNSTMDYYQTQSARYGNDIVSSDSEGENIVSIENDNCGEVGVFDGEVSGISSQSACDESQIVPIEDISDGETDNFK